MWTKKQEQKAKKKWKRKLRQDEHKGQGKKNTGMQDG